MATGRGKVWLVGAGPGDPGLLTLRGREALAAADVVFYDRLVNEALLTHAPPEAELIRRPPRSEMSQADIIAFLVERAGAGQIVCRLKGGDPFLFGRGGEEAEALAEAGIPFEVVPGVTSALAVPAYAGIPVTHRALSSTLGIVTAHEDPDKPESALRWEFLARCVDTGLYLMGVESLERIVRELLAHGKPPQTPVAVIRWGTLPRQRTVVGILGDIAERCREAQMQPPALIVVGEVVRLRERLRWFDARPLFGMRVVVTRAREQAGPLAEALTAAGAAPLLFPTIRFEAVASPDLSGLDGGCDWVILTSANAVRFLRLALADAGRDVRALGAAKIAVVGAKTRQAVEALGLRVDFAPSRFTGAALAEEFPEALSGKRVLLPRADLAPPTLPEALRAAGAEVDAVTLYRTLPADEGAAEMAERLAAGEVDAVTFASSSAARNFRAVLPESDLAGCLVACIGPETAKTARALGYRVDAVAEPHTVEGMVAALESAAGASESAGEPDA